jgi:TolB-like protein/class 3 adenylate cyclase
MGETRKIAAILVADVVGYARLVGADEDRILARLRALRSDMIDPTIAVHHGRVVKRTGDGSIVEFRSVIDAVRCALEMQSGMVERNAGLPPERRIEFRVGIHLGDIVEESDGDLMGDGVNIAARLEGICDVGGICISEDVYRQVRDKLKEQFVDLGERTLKNIARPVRAYQVVSDRNATKAPPGAAEPTSTRLLPDKPALAVLPFQNMSGDPEQEYFADGIVEDIITALSRFNSLAVVARNSSFVYKGRAVDVRQAGKELGVRYVLEGSARRAGNRLRITAQLVDSVTGAHLWARNFDGALEDVFDFQDTITENVATLVEPHIQAAEIERSRRERPGSVATYDIYLQALTKISSETAKDNAEAYELLTKALALEPDNGVFLAHAAWALEHRITMGWPSFGPDDRQKCADLARRGLEHAGGDAMLMAHCGMSLLLGARDYDWGMAIVQAAVEANPNNLLIVARAGVANLICGSIEDALTYLHRANRLSPGDVGAHFALTGIAGAHLTLGDYDEALIWATRSLASNPNFDPTFWMLIAANAHLGRMDEAHRFLERLKRNSPGVTIASIIAARHARDPSRHAALIDGLKLAGLEEG